MKDKLLYMWYSLMEWMFSTKLGFLILAAIIGSVLGLIGSLLIDANFWLFFGGFLTFPVISSIFTKKIKWFKS